jgi:hypothetical protein
LRSQTQAAQASKNLLPYQWQVFFVAQKSNSCGTTAGILSKHFGPVSPQQFVHRRLNLHTVLMAVPFNHAQMMVAVDPLYFY